jgi:CRP-like cAMP-binding protein
MMEAQIDRRRPALRTDPEGKMRLFSASPLGSIEGAAREAVLELGRLEDLPKHHILMVQGEAPRSFFLLGEGRVRLERSRGARTFPLGHRGPGEVVGEAALSGGVAGESATVVDTVLALALPMPGFRRLFAQDAAVRDAVLAAQVGLHDAAQRRLASLLLLGVEARLAEFLLGVVGRWGRPHAEGELVGAPFTHAEIAALIGSTRETVTLLLGKLKREGTIGFDRRRIVVRARPALQGRVAAGA